ncbi:hypothetical protein [Sphingomonas cavernae]|uniref:Uncharacterized protein n=1 Tax=Sphingomonas cavernae TaxID=2320861 RepID=A0A418WJZ2_9SPHN|nr:hypothetical protein [Sphingomonas cavernae]RJF90354.1 hypothetical protein D3876_08845 [Sphingomonas cavernae]
MAYIATTYNWVTVRSRVWTKIWQGPLLQGFVFQFLEFGMPLGSSTGNAMVSWTLEGFSAAPPFYQRSSGTSPAPPLTGSGWGGSAAAVLSFRTSPWVEFNVLTNRGCLAHIYVI